MILAPWFSSFVWALAAFTTTPRHPSCHSSPRDNHQDKDDTTTTTTTTVPTASTCLSYARIALAQNDTDTAFDWLTRAHGINPHAAGLTTAFADLFRARIQLSLNNDNDNDIAMDRIGLGCLLMDQRHYAAAALEFQAALLATTTTTTAASSLPAATTERARSSLYKARAATCDWRQYDTDTAALLDSIRISSRSSSSSSLHKATTTTTTSTDRMMNRMIPSVHPYEALLWPCLSLSNATAIARQYAHRAMQRVGSGTIATRTTTRTTTIPTPPVSLSTTTTTTQAPPQSAVPFVKVVSYDRTNPLRGRPIHMQTKKKQHKNRHKKIRLGYISNDFTGRHPLGLLMQDFFSFHNVHDMEVFLYSLMPFDGSHQVVKMRQAVAHYTDLSSFLSPQQAAQVIQADDCDILVDLTGYTGSSIGMEILALRVAPVQMGFMGFPASHAAPFVDYLVCDETVVPRQLRPYYTENLFFMPHCFFANSHKYLPTTCEQQQSSSTTMTRATYGLPPDDFVFCCHNRPEKIDPITFQSWCRVLRQVPNSCLWILSSGPEMEQNLRHVAQNMFGLAAQDRLVFCDMVPRDEHLQRIRLADLFLDTPAYNAHTTGCDCLIAGVPMVSLLRDDDKDAHPVTVLGPWGVATQKMASRVGASFLRTLQLDKELVASTMTHYERIMVQCATDPSWFAHVRQRLVEERQSSPLFDMERWVRNWEAGLIELATNEQARGKDVYVVEG